EPRALQIRTRFVGEDGDALAAFDRRAYDAERRAVAGRGQRAGVAVRKDGGAIAEELGAEAANAVVRCDVFIEHLLRLDDEIAARTQHAIDRPGEIHGGRPRRLQLRG